MLRRNNITLRLIVAVTACLSHLSMATPQSAPDKKIEPEQALADFYRKTTLLEIPKSQRGRLHVTRWPRSCLPVVDEANGSILDEFFACFRKNKIAIENISCRATNEAANVNKIASCFRDKGYSIEVSVPEPCTIKIAEYSEPEVWPGRVYISARAVKLPLANLAPKYFRAERDSYEVSFEFNDGYSQFASLYSIKTSISNGKWIDISRLGKGCSRSWIPWRQSCEDDLVEGLEFPDTPFDMPFLQTWMGSHGGTIKYTIPSSLRVTDPIVFAGIMDAVLKKCGTMK